MNETVEMLPKKTHSPGVGYEIIKQIGVSDAFTTYACIIRRAGKPDREGILKIANSVAMNGILDREADLLRDMRFESQSIEEEYKEANCGKETFNLNYHFTFPKVQDSFICVEQGGRRINLLSFWNIADTIGELEPLSHIRDRLGCRIDARSSAWILGKLLKTLVFTHSVRVVGVSFDGDNILINRDKHFVALFDWSMAKRATGKLDPKLKAAEIAEVTKSVVYVMGFDPEDGKIRATADLPEEYAVILRRLIEGRESRAVEAHKKFYAVVESLWGRKFHSFTSFTTEKN